MLSRLLEFVLAAGIALAGLAVLGLMAVGVVVWLAGGRRPDPAAGSPGAPCQR